MHRSFAIALALSSACAVAPAGDEHRLSGKLNNGGTVDVIFATQQANAQYCVYKHELTPRALQHNPAAILARATALTTHSIAIDDLRKALLLESTYTSRAYNTAPSLLYPLPVCVAAVASLPILRQKLLAAGVALLSCGTSALSTHKAIAARAEGEKIARASIEQLLADATHRNDAVVTQLPRVLSWLVSESSSPCPSTAQQEGRK